MHELREFMPILCGRSRLDLDANATIESGKGNDSPHYHGQSDPCVVQRERDVNTLSFLTRVSKGNDANRQHIYFRLEFGNYLEFSEESIRCSRPGLK